MMKRQSPNQIVDFTNWKMDCEYPYLDLTTVQAWGLRSVKNSLKVPTLKDILKKVVITFA